MFTRLVSCPPLNCVSAGPCVSCSVKCVPSRMPSVEINHGVGVSRREGRLRSRSPHLDDWKSTPTIARHVEVFPCDDTAAGGSVSQNRTSPRANGGRCSGGCRPAEQTSKTWQRDTKWLGEGHEASSLVNSSSVPIFRDQNNAYRFNRRYELADLVARLVYVAVRSPPLADPLLTLAGTGG